MKTEWTIGKGIAYGLKWIAIMGIIIALFAFIQFVMKFQAGYFEKPEVWDVDRPIIGGNCGTVSPDGRTDCCIRKYGEEYYWDEPKLGCVKIEGVG